MEPLDNKWDRVAGLRRFGLIVPFVVGTENFALNVTDLIDVDASYLCCRRCLLN